MYSAVAYWKNSDQNSLHHPVQVEATCFRFFCCQLSHHLIWEVHYQSHQCHLHRLEEVHQTISFSNFTSWLISSPIFEWYNFGSLLLSEPLAFKLCHHWHQCTRCYQSRYVSGWINFLQVTTKEPNLRQRLAQSRLFHCCSDLSTSHRSFRTPSLTSYGVPLFSLISWARHL